MTVDRDTTTRVVRSWLQTDEHESADRVLGAVLDRLDTTPQRRATWWPARRLPTMNNAVKYGLAAVIVAVAALLGYSYLVAPNVGGPGLGDPTPSPSAIPTSVAALGNQEPLSAGRYQVNPALPMNVTVEVPDGWSASGAWVVIGPKGNEAPDGMAIRFYAGNLDLYRNPFVAGEGVLDPAVGPSVDDLVAAMVNHSDWIVTGTEPITIDGYAGQVVHVTLPEGTSENNPFYMFREGGGEIWGFRAGQLHDLHVVDVAGERLVVEAFHYPGTSDADLAAQQAVLDSIQLEAP